MPLTPPKKIKSISRKRGDGKETRAKILEVATQLFVERGYAEVGMREIAAKAGVAAAMINRYFGTKQALFLEIMGDAFSLVPFMHGPRAEFGQRMASPLLNPHGPFESRSDEEAHFKILQIVLRSASTDGAPPEIQSFLDTQLWRPLIDWLGGKNANERAELIVAILMGLILMNRKISSPSQKKGQTEILASLFANTIQSYVDPE